MSFLYDVRSGKVVKSKLYNNDLLLKDALSFNPLTLFKGGKQGVWYDPSDKSTLFQDVAGTVAVTKDGDPVALMRDKSGNGNHATQSVSTSRPTYKTNGALHWLEFDGVDDYFDFNCSLGSLSIVSAGVFFKGVQAEFALGTKSSNSATSAKIGATSKVGLFLRLISGNNNSTSKLREDAANVLIGARTSLGVITSANGDEKISGADNSQAAQLWTYIGRTDFSAGQHLKGNIYSVLMVDKYTHEDMLSTQAYIANKAGVIL